jgi:mono/diheme cytochrome c family protein
MTLSLGLATVSQAADLASAMVKVDDASFKCMRQMTPVRHFYVDNLLGDISATLAAANAPKGAPYPTGSVVQLVPTEVMVKRESGFSPATGDWEFFELEVNEQGSKIGKRGFAEVNNRFGKNCFACHAPAREPWDFVCESNHGCEAIPIDHKMTGALQRSDPRCGPAVPEEGDTLALLKLRAMVTLGATIGWFKSLF